MKIFESGMITFFSYEESESKKLSDDLLQLIKKIEKVWGSTEDSLNPLYIVFSFEKTISVYTDFNESLSNKVFYEKIRSIVPSEFYFLLQKVDVRNIISGSFGSFICLDQIFSSKSVKKFFLDNFLIKEKYEDLEKYFEGLSIILRQSCKKNRVFLLNKIIDSLGIRVKVVNTENKTKKRITFLEFLTNSNLEKCFLPLWEVLLDDYEEIESLLEFAQSSNAFEKLSADSILSMRKLLVFLVEHTLKKGSKNEIFSLLFLYNFFPFYNDNCSEYIALECVDLKKEIENILFHEEKIKKQNIDEFIRLCEKILFESDNWNIKSKILQFFQNFYSIFNNTTLFKDKSLAEFVLEMTQIKNENNFSDYSLKQFFVDYVSLKKLERSIEAEQKKIIYEELLFYNLKDLFPDLCKSWWSWIIFKIEKIIDYSSALNEIDQEIINQLECYSKFLQLSVKCDSYDLNHYLGVQNIIEFIFFNIIENKSISLDDLKFEDSLTYDNLKDSKILINQIKQIDSFSTKLYESISDFNLDEDSHEWKEFQEKSMFGFLIDQLLEILSCDDLVARKKLGVINIEASEEIKKLFLQKSKTLQFFLELIEKNYEDEWSEVLKEWNRKIYEILKLPSDRKKVNIEDIKTRMQISFSSLDSFGIRELLNIFDLVRFDHSDQDHLLIVDASSIFDDANQVYDRSTLRDLLSNILDVVLSRKTFLGIPYDKKQKSDFFDKIELNLSILKKYLIHHLNKNEKLSLIGPTLCMLSIASNHCATRWILEIEQAVKVFSKPCEASFISNINHKFYDLRKSIVIDLVRKMVQQDVLEFGEDEFIHTYNYVRTKYFREIGLENNFEGLISSDHGVSIDRSLDEFDFFNKFFDGIKTGFLHLILDYPDDILDEYIFSGSFGWIFERKWSKYFQIKVPEENVIYKAFFSYIREIEVFNGQLSEFSISKERQKELLMLKDFIHYFHSKEIQEDLEEELGFSFLRVGTLLCEINKGRKSNEAENLLSFIHQEEYIYENLKDKNVFFNGLTQVIFDKVFAKVIRKVLSIEQESNISQVKIAMIKRSFKDVPEKFDYVLNGMLNYVNINLTSEIIYFYFLHDASCRLNQILNDFQMESLPLNLITPMLKRYFSAEPQQQKKILKVFCEQHTKQYVVYQFQNLFRSRPLSRNVLILKKFSDDGLLNFKNWTLF